MIRHSPPPIASQKPHIVLVNLWRVVNAKGGTEKVFCEMANELVERGYDVTAIYCDSATGEPGFEVRPEVNFINAYRTPRFPPLQGKLLQKIRTFSLSSAKRKQKRRLAEARHMGNLLRDAMKGLPPADLFISSQLSATHVLTEALNTQVPVISMFHQAPVIFDETGSLAAFSESLEKSAVLQVLMPEYVTYLAERFPKNRIVCIPNTAPQHPESVLPDYRSKTLLNVARVAEQKRTLLLVEAFALLKDRFPDWTVNWWGETHTNPAYTEEVMRRIRQFGLQDRFVFCGITDDVPSKMRSASVFAFPSVFEGQSLALLEAFSIGLPTAACTDCPSVNTMVRDGENGVLTEPTPEAYAEGLARLMESEELRRTLGACAKKDAKAYAPEAVWDAWDSLIREILGKEA